jgi:RNA polymerase sigma-70 factor (sigma-E family)
VDLAVEWGDGVANEAAQELFRANYLLLVRLAMRLVGDQETAEDVVQDVFVALAHPREIGDPLHYLRRAVVNRARSVLRRRRVAGAFWAQTRPQIAEPADASTFRRSERQRMLAAIQQLPQRQREVVVLRYYEDLGVSEIAAVLRISQGAVSSALNRALAALASGTDTTDAE